MDAVQTRETGGGGSWRKIFIGRNRNPLSLHPLSTSGVSVEMLVKMVCVISGMQSEIVVRAMKRLSSSLSSRFSTVLFSSKRRDDFFFLNSAWMLWKMDRISIE